MTNPETAMAPPDFDAAACPVCRKHTPIRLSEFASMASDQKLREMSRETFHVACIRCGRVYSYQSQELRPVSSTELYRGLPAGVSLYVFASTIDCEDLNCEFQLPVVSARRSNSPAGYETRARSEWSWAKGEKTTCPWNHEILLPPWVGER